MRSGFDEHGHVRRKDKEVIKASIGHSGGTSGEENSKAVKGNKGKIGGGNQGKNGSKGCGDKSNKGSNGVWKSCGEGGRKKRDRGK